MKKVFNAGDSDFTETLFNDEVIVNGVTLSINLSETSLVDEIMDQFTGRVTMNDYDDNTRK